MDLTGKSNITLSLDHLSLADEADSLPMKFTAHYYGEGISLRIDGINWVTITSLSGSFTVKTYLLDAIIDRPVTIAGNNDLSDVRIKFQQYDNTWSPNDGREFDNIQLY